MGKSKTPQPSELARRRIEEEQGRQDSRYSTLRPEISTRYNETKAKNDALFNELSGRYRNTLDNSIPQTRAGFQNLADTGGVDATGKERIRGKGIFDEYAKTGGWDDNRISNFRGRISSAAPAFYGSLRNELERSRGLSGSSGTGFDSSLAKLAREQSKSHTENIREGELGLASSVDEGRRFGAEGISNAERALQGLLSQNRIAGLTGVADTDRSTLAGLEGMGKLRTETPSDLAFLDRMLQMEGMDFEQRAKLIALMQNVPDKKSFFDKFGNSIIGGIGSLLGGAAS